MAPTKKALITRMPVLFIGHGSPENAILDNEFSREWKRIAASFPKPKAILCISAHWETDGTFATAMPEPRTIHDFYGFPKPLYDARYPAPGSPDLAKRLKALVRSAQVQPDMQWGLDHGCWSVLLQMYPNADIPVVQLSLNALLSPEEHLEIGKSLAPLRDEGVLILGSGNIVHNLMMIRWHGPAFAWATEFDAKTAEALRQRDHNALTEYLHGRSAKLAVPTSEHYLPLLYATGAAGASEPEFFCESVFAGSLSMRCVIWR